MFLTNTVQKYTLGIFEISVSTKELILTSLICNLHFISSRRIPPPPSGPAPEPPYASGKFANYRATQAPGYGEGPPPETRLQETRADRIAETGRFNDGL